MASKSGHLDSDKGAEVEELLDAAETLLDRVRVLYEQYFLGIQKQAPSHLHHDLERKLRELSQLQVRNTALRYRLATMQQKFGSYSTYWRRTLRQIENGTYARNLSRIGRDAARTGAMIPEEILAAMPKRMREQVVRDRDAALAAQRRRAGDAGAGAGAKTVEIDEADFDIDLDLEEAALEDVATIHSKPPTRVYQLSEDDELDVDALFAAITDEDRPETSAPPVRAVPSAHARPAAPLPREHGGAASTSHAGARAGTASMGARPEPGPAAAARAAAPARTPEPGAPIAAPGRPKPRRTTDPGVGESAARPPAPPSRPPRAGTQSGAAPPPRPPRAGTESGPGAAPVVDAATGLRPPARRPAPAAGASSSPASSSAPPPRARTAGQPAASAEPAPSRGAAPRSVSDPARTQAPRATTLGGAGLEGRAPAAASPPVGAGAPRPGEPIGRVVPPSGVSLGMRRATGAPASAAPAGDRPPPRAARPSGSGIPAIPDIPAIPAAPRPRAPTSSGAATPRPASAGSSAAPASGAARPLPPGVSQAEVTALYAQYVKARSSVGERSDARTYDRLVRTIEQQAPKIMEEHRAKGVEFQVVVKDNQVVLRAKPKP
ncbi:MAG: MXAN_5187 C-terminal domain-containing protein [Kofleriaceae bacterium]